MYVMKLLKDPFKLLLILGLHSLKIYNENFEEFIKKVVSIDIKTFSNEKGEESKKECIPEKDDSQSEDSSSPEEENSEQEEEENPEQIISSLNRSEKTADSANDSPNKTKEDLGIDQDPTMVSKGAIFKEENELLKNMGSEEAYEKFERSLMKKTLLREDNDKNKKKEEEKKLSQKHFLKKDKPKQKPYLMIKYLSDKITDPPIEEKKGIFNNGLRFIQSKFFSIKNCVNINDPQVSSKHAEIICEKLDQNDRIFKLCDCGSLNGTYVRIFSEVLLSQGMVFEIGNYQFSLEEILEKGEKIIIKIENLLDDKDIFERKCCILNDNDKISIGNCLDYKKDEFYIYLEDEQINDIETVVLNRKESGINMKVKSRDSKLNI